MFAKEIKKMVPIDYVSNYKTWMSESAGITTCSVNVAPEGQFFFLSPNPHECFAKYSKYKK